MRTLPTQPLKDQYWLDVEAQLKSIFYEIVFAPVMDVLRKTTPQSKELQHLYNAGGNLTSLLIAIRSGRVQYKAGVFSGDFSVAISKDLRIIGATFDHRTKVYKLDVSVVPEFIRAEATAYESTAKAAHAEIHRRLDEVQMNLERLVDQNNIEADDAIRHIERGWKKSAEILEVQPKLTEASQEELADEYNRNLKLYVKAFSLDSIATLRQAVDENAMAGYRFDKLTEVIRHRYGVTANKAKFLARQETGLFMAKYRKKRFGEAGVRRYRWSTANDERVRDSHKHLNGRVFSYDDPPITDRSTGAKNNPGEDFNCRCLDIPLLELASGQFAGNFS